VEGERGALLEGLADRYLRVSFRPPTPGAGERFPGTFQRVRVVAAAGRRLEGEWVGEGMS
jgi:hypothetical protein